MSLPISQAVFNCLKQFDFLVRGIPLVLPLWGGGGERYYVFATRAHDYLTLKLVYFYIGVKLVLQYIYIHIYCDIKKEARSEFLKVLINTNLHIVFECRLCE